MQKHILSKPVISHLKKYLNIYCDVQTYIKVGASSLLGLDKHCGPTRMRIMVNVQGKGLAAM